MNVDELDESKVPTAPMKAVSKPPGRPMPSLPDDDDDDDRNVRRVGTRENPFTDSIHPRISLDEETKTKVRARLAAQEPSPVAVLLRVLVLVGVLSALAFGAWKLASG